MVKVYRDPPERSAGWWVCVVCQEPKDNCTIFVEDDGQRAVRTVVCWECFEAMVEDVRANVDPTESQ